MKRVKLLVVIGLLLAALAAATLFFVSRPPVLVVTDIPFAALYGERRILRRQVTASLALFRRVTPVMIADDASPDILIAAILYAYREPFAVLFPSRFFAVAERFHEEFPEITAVAFRGVNPVSEPPEGGGSLKVFGTDRETDLLRAGLFAGAMGFVMAAERDEEEEEPDPQRIHVLLHDRFTSPEGGELFAAAAAERDPDSAVVLASSPAHLPNMSAVSSIVVAGIGASVIEENPGIPTILFTWLEPTLLPGNVVAVFDDSHWALAVPAVRMAAEGVSFGAIPSKTLIFSRRIADNSLTRLLKRLARTEP